MWPGRFMGMRNAPSGREFQPSTQRAVAAKKARGSKRPSTTLAELKAALAREGELRREKRELLQHQVLLAQEFEHRLVNGLQLIASLLSLQSQTAATPEATGQLIVAARRVAALGRVHHRLHLLDHEENVEFKQYLQNLCEDLTGLLFQERSDYAIVVESANVEIPTELAIPLGFIVNELITNSTKHATGNIMVRFEMKRPARYSLSVIRYSKRISIND